MGKHLKEHLAGLLVGAGIVLHSGSAAALNLMDAYDAALKNDAAFRSARYASEAGAENRILGRSNLLPSVSANYSGGKNHSDIDYGGRKSQQDYISRNLSLQVRQSLFNFDSWSRYKQGNLQADYSEAVFMSEQQQVAIRVVGAYVEVLFKQDQLALAKAERDMYLERMKVNDRLYAKGEGTVTDMLETRARLDVAEGAVLEAQDNLAATRTTLEHIIGQDAGVLAPLTSEFSAPSLDMLSFDAWKQVMLERNPDLKAKLISIDLNQQEVNKARAGHMPRVDVTASLSKSVSDSVTTIDQEYKTRSIGFQVTIPLYSGGAVNASTRQAVANREKARADADAEVSKQLEELRKDYDILVSSVPRIAALSKAVKSGESLVTATEQSIKGGVRINLDLLDAQRQLSATRRDLAQMRYTYVITYLRLRAAAGILSIDDVRAMAGYFH